MGVLSRAKTRPSVPFLAYAYGRARGPVLTLMLRERRGGVAVGMVQVIGNKGTEIFVGCWTENELAGSAHNEVEDHQHGSTCHSG
jgi:hypothetical protein